MRTLSTDVAAAALGVERKTLDNILSREARRLIGKGRRGRSRRISMPVLECLAIALVINRDLGTGIARALELAEQVLVSPQLPVQVGALTALRFDLDRLRKALDPAVEDALEGVATPVRGRPTRLGRRLEMPQKTSGASRSRRPAA